MTFFKKIRTINFLKYSRHLPGKQQIKGTFAHCLVFFAECVLPIIRGRIRSSSPVGGDQGFGSLQHPLPRRSHPGDIFPHGSACRRRITITGTGDADQLLDFILVRFTGLCMFSYTICSIRFDQPQISTSSKVLSQI